MLLLFSTAVLAGAFLLFVVQPLYARLVLPLLGGSPAVWTTSMLFFQAALLAGYTYVHLTTKRLTLERQMLLHAIVLLVPLALLPVNVRFDIPGPGSDPWPITALLVALATGIGLPFFALSATAPLLQRWFSATAHPSAHDPYFLYAASNTGSLAALLLYPLAFEPFVALRTQRLAWSWGYAALVILVLVSAAMTWRTRRNDAGAASFEVVPPTPWGRKLRWLLLSFVPSGLLLAVTAHISTDIAAVPLLWVVPLAIYLATFIVAFGGGAAWIVPPTRRLMPLALLPLVLVLVTYGGGALWFALTLHLLVFACLSLLCHAELARLRPEAASLTRFYVWLALGGMLGGVFNTIVAPRVFTSVAEYPLLLAAACFVIAAPAELVRLVREPVLLAKPLLAGALAAIVLAFGRALDLPPTAMMPLLAAAALVAFMLSRQPARFAAAVGAVLVAGAVVGPEAWGEVLRQERTFFGVYRVTTDAGRGLISLYHGTTLHGRQAVTEGPPEPLTYYHRGSPIADVLATRPPTTRAVAVVGLGVGSLAAYARPGERWTFYEIDPVVADLARDTRFFTFLESCGGACDVVIGDGRVAIAESRDTYDVIVLDAFSSDAIPVHLLTREALDVYLSRLAPDGVLAFHISNRHFDLHPIIGRLAAEHELTTAGRFGRLAGGDAAGASISDWVALARTPERLAPLLDTASWERVEPGEARVWTDDFANVWAALRWR